MCNFVHDEFIAELAIDGNLQETCKLMATLMIKGMRQITPRVTVKVEQAMMIHWDKRAKTCLTYPEKDLACWTPDIVMVSPKDTTEGWRSLIPYSLSDIKSMGPSDLLKKVPSSHRALWTDTGSLFGLQPIGSIVV